MKTGTRKAIATMLALALSTTIFTGCSKEETSSTIDTSNTSSSTSSLSNPIGGDIDNGKLFRDEIFDMRYKHWYDNPEVVESQKDIFEAALEGTDTGEKYMNTFPIYRDPSGYKYYISGRTPVYITGGSTDNNGAWQLRNTDMGNLRYVDKVANDISKVSENLSPSSDYTDYIGDRAFANLGEDIMYDVYLNNINVGATYSVDRGTMPISKWLEKYNLASLKLPESMVSNPELYTNLPDVPTLYLCTGAGQSEITFDTIDDPEDTEWNGSWKIEYKSEGFEQAAKKSEIMLTNGVLCATPRAIETVLGFKILVDDDSKTINIITDNKDLAGVDSTIDTSSLAPTPPESNEDPSLIEQPTSEPSEPGTTTPEPTTSEPEWTEESITPITMYVNMSGASSRKKAVLGAETVKAYHLNDKLTIIAKTNTDYCKLEDGTYMHGDYLSSTKIEGLPSNPSSGSSSGNSNSGNPSAAPKDGDTKIEGDKTYMYFDDYGWVDLGDGHTIGTPATDPGPWDGQHVGSF